MLFMGKCLCGLKTTSMGGGGGGQGEDDFGKNQCIKPYKGESVPTLLTEIGDSLCLGFCWCQDTFWRSKAIYLTVPH